MFLSLISSVIMNIIFKICSSFTINNLTECILNSSESVATKTFIMSLGTVRDLHHAGVAVMVRIVMDFVRPINIFFSNSGLLVEFIGSVLTATKSSWFTGLGSARVDTQAAILCLQLEKKRYNVMKISKVYNKTREDKEKNMEDHPDLKLPLFPECYSGLGLDLF